MEIVKELEITELDAVVGGSTLGDVFKEILRWSYEQALLRSRPVQHVAHGKVFD